MIADLVGDNVGDCAGSMADVFESIAGEIIGTMILGSSLALEVSFFPFFSCSKDRIPNSLFLALLSLLYGGDRLSWRILKTTFSSLSWSTPMVNCCDSASSLFLILRCSFPLDRSGCQLGRYSASQSP